MAGTDRLTPAEAQRQRPDLSLAATGPSGDTACASVWWRGVPTLPGHRVGIVGHYAAATWNPAQPCSRPPAMCCARRAPRWRSVRWTPTPGIAIAWSPGARTIPRSCWSPTTRTRGAATSRAQASCRSPDTTRRAATSSRHCRSTPRRPSGSKTTASGFATLDRYADRRRPARTVGGRLRCLRRQLALHASHRGGVSNSLRQGHPLGAATDGDDRRACRPHRRVPVRIPRFAAGGAR